tara:strand:+ start:206 stop:772 length:567 start_codon:yes stop_codon:yes gene_type:complete
MKKTISFLPLLLININLITAQDYLSEIKESLRDVIINPTENMLIIQIIIFLLFFAVIFTSLQKSKFLEDKKINVIIALAISILAIYYLSQEMLSHILTSYTALGIIIITFLPLVILLFFIHRSKMSEIGRKMILGIFAIFFLYLWYQNFKMTGEPWNEIYVITAIAIAVSWRFDKNLHKMIMKKYKPE